MNVRQIRNVSENDVGIQIDDRTTVFLKPGTGLKDVDVRNMESVKKFVNVEYDLSEITPIKEGRQQLNG